MVFCSYSFIKFSQCLTESGGALIWIVKKISTKGTLFYAASEPYR
jgi:hypothetical protein